MHKSIKQTALRAAVLAALCSAGLAQAATIVITSRDPANVGFNDPTPVSPVGGNAGTTLGQQRMIVYRYVADIWEKALQSDVTITVNAGWESLTCTSSSAVLGSASAWNLWHDFANAKPGTWYPQALANKLAGTNLSIGQADDGTGYGNVDIKTQFNGNLGNAGCLDGLYFYLGLDGKAGQNINFVETLLHELGHGLGFSVLSVQTSTGLRINAAGTAYASDGLPSVWEQYMYDSAQGKSWLNMNYLERKISAVTPSALAWTGPQAWAGAAMLSSTPSIKVTTSAPGYNGYYAYGTAAFGPAVNTGLNLGTLATIAADTTGAGQGCNVFSAADAAAVAGKVAIIDRGVCGFAVKAKNAQNAGAIGVIIANNAAGTPPGLGGTDSTVVIPTVSVSQADGVTLKAAITASAPYGGRGKVGVASAALSVDASKKAGADAAGRPLFYTPSTLAAGSSVSHWDVSATPNLLMEPNINSDLTTILVPPYDLTLPLLKDIGW
jgi:hypothetical protein